MDWRVVLPESTMEVDLGFRESAGGGEVVPLLLLGRLFCLNRGVRRIIGEIQRQTRGARQAVLRAEADRIPS